MSPTDRTRKIIWVESGGRCAICCLQVLTTATPTDDPSIFGEEAHIVPRSPDGPRSEARAGLTQEQIDHHSNLIMLCSAHHKMIDDQPRYYTVERLRQIKEEHKLWIQSLGAAVSEGRQADAVTVWPSVVLSDPADLQSALAWGATVKNGSRLPIYQVGVGFSAIAPYLGKSTVVIEMLPPGEWAVSGGKVYRAPEHPSTRPDAWKLPERHFQTDLRFTDSDGKVWLRDINGLLTPE